MCFIPLIHQHFAIYYKWYLLKVRYIGFNQLNAPPLLPPSLSKHVINVRWLSGPCSVPSKLTFTPVPFLAWENTTISLLQVIKR